MNNVLNIIESLREREREGEGGRERGEGGERERGEGERERGEGGEREREREREREERGERERGESITKMKDPLSVSSPVEELSCKSFANVDSLDLEKRMKTHQQVATRKEIQKKIYHVHASILHSGR